jgi:uncharacterized protein DUF4389
MEASATSEPHPIRVRVTDDLRRSRLTVFFRLLLVIPHLLWLSLWAILAILTAMVNWFATLFSGRSPVGMHNFLARFLVYSTHVTAYLALLANPYPGFAGKPGYPVDLVVAPPERQNRWKTGFRLLLAIPALLLTNVLQGVLQILAILGWFVSLALGRMPEGMRNLGVYCLRFQQQTHGYLLLLTDRYPSLSFPKVD